MTESKTEKLTIVLIAFSINAIITSIVSLFFQDVVLQVVVFSIGLFILLIVYFFGKNIRIKLILKFRNPLKKIIEILQKHEKTKLDYEKEMKLVKDLYKSCTFCQHLKENYIPEITFNTNPFKIVFGKMGEPRKCRIFLYKNYQNKPIKFQVERLNPKALGPYNSHEYHQSGMDSEAIQNQKQVLNDCVEFLKILQN